MCTVAGIILRLLRKCIGFGTGYVAKSSDTVSETQWYGIECKVTLGMRDAFSSALGTVTADEH